MNRETAVAAAAPARTFDLSSGLRAVIAVGGGSLTLLILWSLVRLALGAAPPMPQLASPAILAHLAAVIPAVPLGAYILLARKGDARHRLLGKIWMALMVVTAVSAIFIRSINPGHFSWIHLFVVLVLVSVPRALLAIRRGLVEKHRGIVTGMYIGGALVAGFVAFAPHRTMWSMAFG